MGRFPPGWAEWNDKFRDSVRDFWKGAAPAGALAPALCASADIFNHRGRKPWASLNFVTAHDGFTLHDLVSYAEKHNEANGENNGDGSNNNRSSNDGVEGPTDDPAIVAHRQRQMRNMLATVLCAQGTPMILAGDEFARTQQGNNNAYCQDNSTSWVDWRSAREQRALTQFVQRLAALRHELPLLRQNRFLTGETVETTGMKDVAWLVADGSEITQEQWVDHQFRCFGMLLGGDPDPCLIIINGGAEDVMWTLPPVCAEREWLVGIDTSQMDEAPTTPWHDPIYPVRGRSVALLHTRTL
jgi:glycogen operon protein